jgi:two-component system chemotaxis response regulator CheB
MVPLGLVARELAQPARRNDRGAVALPRTDSLVSVHSYASMFPKEVIVIGTSMGGIEALKTIVAGLPPDFSAAVCIVLHVGAHGLGLLPEILHRAGPLPASNARDGQEIEAGHIYVAPADHHLLVESSGHLRLSHGPKENRTRPAVDPLFRSAAVAFGSRVIGVVLTGWLDDGTAGLWAVKERGGTAIVQDPNDALAASMPQSALKHVAVDHCVPLQEIAPLLVRLTTAPAREKGTQPMSKLMETEVRIAREERAMDTGLEEVGVPAPYACPECHGVLLQLKEGSNLRFRCHTGHAYSIESLLSELTEKTEEVLWTAIRSIEETVLLLRRMSSQLVEHQHHPAAETMLQRAYAAQQRADLVRKAVFTHEKISSEGLSFPKAHLTHG